MTTATMPDATRGPVASLDRLAAWDLLMTVTDSAPVSIDVDGTPLTISVAHRREFEPSMGPNPFGVQLLPVGVEPVQAQPLVSGTVTVSYAEVTREFSWKPGFVSDVRWDVAEFIESLVARS